jgi:hypothetical protein
LFLPVWYGLATTLLDQRRIVRLLENPFAYWIHVEEETASDADAVPRTSKDVRQPTQH